MANQAFRPPTGHKSTRRLRPQAEPFTHPADNPITTHAHIHGHGNSHAHAHGHTHAHTHTQAQAQAHTQAHSHSHSHHHQHLALPTHTPSPPLRRRLPASAPPFVPASVASVASLPSSYAPSAATAGAPRKQVGGNDITPRPTHHHHHHYVRDDAGRTTASATQQIPASQQSQSQPHGKTHAQGQGQGQPTRERERAVGEIVSTLQTMNKTLEDYIRARPASPPAATVTGQSPSSSSAVGHAGPASAFSGGIAATTLVSSASVSASATELAPSASASSLAALHMAAASMHVGAPEKHRPATSPPPRMMRSPSPSTSPRNQHAHRHLHRRPGSGGRSHAAAIHDEDHYECEDDVLREDASRMQLVVATTTTAPRHRNAVSEMLLWVRRAVRDVVGLDLEDMHLDLDPHAWLARCESPLCCRGVDVDVDVSGVVSGVWQSVEGAVAGFGKKVGFWS